MKRKGKGRSKLVTIAGHTYRLELVTRPKVAEVERRPGGKRRKVKRRKGKR